MHTTPRTVTRLIALGVLALALAGCSSYDRKQSNTLAGAGLGAATGAVLTSGDPWFTLGGAAAGGVLGNVLTKNNNHHRSAKKHSRNYDRYGRNHKHKSYRPGKQKHKTHGRKRHR